MENGLLEAPVLASEPSEEHAETTQELEDRVLNASVVQDAAETASLRSFLTENDPLHDVFGMDTTTVHDALVALSNDAKEATAEITIGSPLVSFSPVATMAPSVPNPFDSPMATSNPLLSFSPIEKTNALEVDAIAPVEGQLLSFSPVAHQAPSSSNEFLHDELLSLSNDVFQVPTSATNKVSESTEAFITQHDEITEEEKEAFVVGMDHDPVHEPVAKESISIHEEEEATNALVNTPNEENSMVDVEDHDVDACGVFETAYDHPTAASEERDDDDEFDGFQSSENHHMTPEEEKEFGAFGAFEASVPMQETTHTMDEMDGGGDFSSNTTEENDAFGDFQTTQPKEQQHEEDDGFDDFSSAMVSSSHEKEEEDGFGSFGGFTSATQPQEDEVDDFDDFGDFTQSTPEFPEPPAPSAPLAPSIPSSSSSSPSVDVASFFAKAFPVAMDFATATEFFHQISSTQPSSSSSELPSTDETSSNEARALTQLFVHSHASYHPSEEQEQPEDSSLQYLQYVLSEKLQVACDRLSADDHQSYQLMLASADATVLKTALLKLSATLFHSSIEDAELRIAQQAALSAQAKIAEQAAAQNQSNRHSLRHLLSRTADKDKDQVSLGVLTPTGASVHKIARFSFGSHEPTDGSTVSGYGSGDDLSGHESDGSCSSTGPQSASKSGTSLMKKFSSFISSRHRSRVLSLRRTGASSDVFSMELNLDTIAGGLDEVKWRCAMCCYDLDEVAQVAPSQIRILSYPNHQVLTGKSDKSALLKLLKPGMVWTIDIGSNTS